MANRVDPDQTPHSAVSDLGLHVLLRSVCPNTSSIYGKKTSTIRAAKNNLSGGSSSGRDGS